MPDFTRHQKKIINRYYEHRDGIMVAKLSEVVGELYLADTDKKRAKLWERAELAMRNLKWKEPQIRHVVDSHKPELLAEHLREWMENHPG
jgi:hypothetical protein